MPEDFGTTADAGNFDPTAGASPTGTDAGQDRGGPSNTQADGSQTRQPGQGRTFTQAELDRILSDRLARERRQYEQRFSELQRQYEMQRGGYGPDYGAQGERDPLEERVAPLVEAVEDLKLDREITDCRNRHPDFDETAVLRVMLDNGLPTVESAYRHWKYDSLATIDVKAIEKAAGEKAIQEYLKSKGATATTLPPIEGKGGGAPTGVPLPKHQSKRDAWKAVEREALEFVRNSRRV